MGRLVHEAIYAELAAVTAIADVVGADPGSRIWRGVIPQRVKNGVARYPCVVVNHTDVDRQKTYCGTVATVQTRVQVDCYAADNPTAWDLAREVRLALIDFRGMLGGVLRVADVSLDSEGEIADLEPGTYRVMQSWQIWHREE